jgi:hypothetical protein
MPVVSAQHHLFEAFPVTQHSGWHLRITAATATNAVDFIIYHRTLCLAMMNNRPEDRAGYKLTGNAKGAGDENFC